MDGMEQNFNSFLVRVVKDDLKWTTINVQNNQNSESSNSETIANRLRPRLRRSRNHLIVILSGNITGSQRGNAIPSSIATWVSRETLWYRNGRRWPQAKP